MRFERKYRLQYAHAASVESALMLHPATFTRQFPDRIVNNIYFDTAELKTFYENLHGVSHREKYRLRWYGDHARSIKSIFEIKKKQNMLGTKVTTPMPGFEEIAFNQISELVNARTGHISKLFPTLMNAYLRSYFISANKNYRLTIDRQLQYYPITGQSIFTQFQYHDPSVIVELKYDQTLDDEAEEVLRYIPFQLTKSSKYVTGMLFAF